FLYPKLGPGQLWEEVARIIEEMGGVIHHHQDVKNIQHNSGQITSVDAVNSKTGEQNTYSGDYFFSTMPVQELISGLSPDAPKEIKHISDGLLYRDFITVGLLLTQLKVKDEKQANKLIKDN